MADRIHIALSPWDLTDSYNRHTAATLVSILEHCSKPVTVHLLYEGRLSVDKPDETRDTMEKYRELGDTYHTEIRFHDIVLPEWVNDTGRKNLMHFTPGTLLRLYLPELLPELDKILYFDCDMVILTDISRLWDISLGGCSIGAVLEGSRDASVYYYTGSKDRNGIDRRRYFNAGFLIMNLERIRLSGTFSETVMKMIFDHPEYPYLDQDVLNILFQEDETLFLDARYNLPVGLRMTNFRLKKELGIVEDTYADCILHFNGTMKPWKIYSGPVDEYYWTYLRKTPWGEDSAVVDAMYAEVRKERKSLLDRVMSTPLNKYLRLAESILKKI